MFNPTRVALPLLATSLFLYGSIPGQCEAKEIWVAPSNSFATSLIGDWATTPEGSTIFNFSIPDDLTEFTGAKVVLIPTRSRNITYDLHLSVAFDGVPHNFFTDARLDLPAALTQGDLVEIDVGPIFPAGLIPGVDNLSLVFQATSFSGAARVAGLRFQYLGTPGEPGLPGPVGLPGLPGDTGSDGPQGNPGATGVQGDMPDHEWNGTALKFESPDGTWGPATDLIGPQGPQGPTGPEGPAGPRGLDGGPVGKIDCEAMAIEYMALYGSLDSMTSPLIWLPRECFAECTPAHIQAHHNDAVANKPGANEKESRAWDYWWTKVGADCDYHPACAGYNAFVDDYEYFYMSFWIEEIKGSYQVGTIAGLTEDYLDRHAAFRIPTACFLHSMSFSERETTVELYQSTFRSMLEMVEAILEYVQAEDALPATLDDLVPTYLDEIPLDGWWGPFVYEILPSGIAQLTSYGSDRLPGDNPRVDPRANAYAIFSASYKDLIMLISAEGGVSFSQITELEDL